MFSLVCHPQTPAMKVGAVKVGWSVAGDGLLHLRWQVDGVGALVAPGKATPGRADGLWQATCFELFLKGAGSAYREFNFSPSGQWAAYHFSHYRKGMAEQPMPVAPVIMPAAEGESFACTVSLPADVLAGAAHAGLSAVIEEQGGRKSYWALAHQPGDPDFHAAACFTIAIGAAEQP